MNNDQILVRRLRESDYFVFEHVFHAYHKKLTVFARKFTGNHDKAIEIVQDVFLKLWNRRKNLEVKKSLEAYLVTITKNQCITFYRSLKTRPKTVSENDILLTELEYEHYQNENILGQLISDDLRKNLKRAVKLLPEQQKKVFEMSRYEGLPLKEIAEKLNLTLRTVETHIYLALKFIKDELKDFIE